MTAPWCLVTDIDGTLIGESESTGRLRRAVLAERAALAERGIRLYWVIATGRRLDSTREVLLESGFDLNEFQALITSVGAELYLGNSTSPCSAYHAHLGSDGFRRSAVLKALQHLPFMSLQPEHEQFEHKVSYFSPDGAEHRAQILGALSELPFPTRTVFSHDEYLDVVPAGGAKGGAVAHLLRAWKVPAPRAVAAGDSGNDASMLEADWHGIVVGNGHRQLAHLRARPNVYFASGRHAAGVLEGLVRLGLCSPNDCD